MGDPLERVVPALREVLDEHRRRVLDDVDRRLADLRAELRAELACAAKPRCLTVAEVCERFRLSRSTWDRSLADRSNGLWALLEPWRIGRRVRVPVAEFEAWLIRRKRR